MEALILDVVNTPVVVARIACPKCGSPMSWTDSHDNGDFGESHDYECLRCHLKAANRTKFPALLFQTESGKEYRVPVDNV